MLAAPNLDAQMKEVFEAQQGELRKRIESQSKRADKLGEGPDFLAASEQLARMEKEWKGFPPAEGGEAAARTLCCRSRHQEGDRRRQGLPEAHGGVRPRQELDREEAAAGARQVHQEIRRHACGQAGRVAEEAARRRLSLAGGGRGVATRRGAGPGPAHRPRPGGGPRSPVRPVAWRQRLSQSRPMPAPLPNDLLVLRRGGLGDTLLLLPMRRALRRGYPHARLVLRRRARVRRDPRRLWGVRRCFVEPGARPVGARLRSR